MTTGKLITGLKTELKTKTHQEIARKMGYRSGSTIHAWLKNKTIPKAATKKVAKYLGVQ